MIPLKIFNLGLIDFNDALRRQREVFSEVKAGVLKSAIIICRHYPVITLGRQADKKNIRLTPEELRDKGIQYREIERGGDVTYHGPGQITIYPIYNLNYFKKDIYLFLRQLEALALAFLQEFGVRAIRREGLTGVWAGDKKIASIGIAIRNWITFHGLSINIKADDLANFRFIRPCGMDINMSCLETELQKEVDIDIIMENLNRRLISDKEGIYGKISIAELGRGH